MWLDRVGSLRKKEGEAASGTHRCLRIHVHTKTSYQLTWELKWWHNGPTSQRSGFKILFRPEISRLFFRNCLMRNSHKCNDHVNFVCLTWLWSFPLGRCGQRTWGGNCCVFPFVYRGRRYNSCTRRGSTRFWCPIVPGYKRGQAWGYCRGKRGEIITRSTFTAVNDPFTTGNCI